MSSTKRRPVIFTAQSKVFFYCRDAVCEFVFRQNAVPLNPFRVFEYFLGDRVDRDTVREGNNNLIRIVDELWVFGEQIADGVLFEILFAKELEKPVRYFTIHNRAEEIREIGIKNLTFEQEIYKAHGKRDRDAILSKILGYDVNVRQPEQLSLLLARDGE